MVDTGLFRVPHCDVGWSMSCSSSLSRLSVLLDEATSVSDGTAIGSESGKGHSGLCNVCKAGREGRESKKDSVLWDVMLVGQGNKQG